MKKESLVFLAICGLLLLHACSSYPSANSAATSNPLEQLVRGNERFAGMHPIHPHESKNRLAEIAEGQHPFAAIICCSDSRVPPEIIFDQGLGDLFVVRTAGNLMGGLEIGSIEYAVEHLGVRQVLVLGHKECGALQAFTGGKKMPGHIKDIVDSIRHEEEIQLIFRDDKNLLDDCIRANILHGVHQLKSQSALLAEKINANELQVLGACYDLKKGLVELVRE